MTWEIWIAIISMIGALTSIAVIIIRPFIRFSASISELNSTIKGLSEKIQVLIQNSEKQEVQLLYHEKQLDNHEYRIKTSEEKIKLLEEKDRT